jgi:Sulfotransferase domain
MSAATPARAPAKPFVRRTPPLPARVFMGAFIYGFVGPMLWGLQKTGRAERAFRRIHDRQRKAFEEKNPFRDYVPGKQDVFVATYAKSGTNWMMQIAYQLAWHGAGEFEHIHSVVPWPDTKVGPGWMRNYAIPLQDATDWERSPERKRVIKTHFDWELLPYSEDARYIMVIRDPKDIFVSSYFFLKDGVLGPAMPSVDTWYKLFMSDGFPIGGSWAANTGGYWAQRHRPNALIVSFKSMKRDLKGTVRRVAQFLDIPASEPLVNVVCEKSSFEYMKGIDHKFRIGKMIPWHAEGAMMRKGTQGGSSELLSRERQREMDAYFIAELKRLGSDFPYEEFCDIA